MKLAKCQRFTGIKFEHISKIIKARWQTILKALLDQSWEPSSLLSLRGSRCFGKICTQKGAQPCNPHCRVGNLWLWRSRRLLCSLGINCLELQESVQTPSDPFTVVFHDFSWNEIQTLKTCHTLLFSFNLLPASPFRQLFRTTKKKRKLYYFHSFSRCTELHRPKSTPTKLLLPQAPSCLRGFTSTLPPTSVTPAPDPCLWSLSPIPAPGRRSQPRVPDPIRSRPPRSPRHTNSTDFTSPAAIFSARQEEGGGRGGGPR